MADSERTERSRRQFCGTPGQLTIRVESCRFRVRIPVAVKCIWAVSDFSVRRDTPAANLGFRRRLLSRPGKQVNPPQPFDRGVVGAPSRGVNPATLAETCTRANVSIFGMAQRLSCVAYRGAGQIGMGITDLAVCMHSALEYLQSARRMFNPYEFRCGRRRGPLQLGGQPHPRHASDAAPQTSSPHLRPGHTTSPLPCGVALLLNPSNLPFHQSPRGYTVYHMIIAGR
jgi:hypothetical protein